MNIVWKVVITVIAFLRGYLDRIVRTRAFHGPFLSCLGRHRGALGGRVASSAWYKPFHLARSPTCAIS
jgi:hypothetical protein